MVDELSDEYVQLKSFIYTLCRPCRTILHIILKF